MIGTPQVDWLRSKRKEVSWSERASCNSGLNIEIDNRSGGERDAGPKNQGDDRAGPPTRATHGEMRGQGRHQQGKLHLKRRIVQVARGVGEKHHKSRQQQRGETGVRPGLETRAVPMDNLERAQILENRG